MSPTIPETAADADVAFVCYPHAEAHAVVAELVDAGCRVVDLSADYRLKDPAGYERWYGFSIRAPDLVARGRLRPSGGLPRSNLQDARLVANPGCYPTSHVPGPASGRGDIDGGASIVDAKSGVSGAGRTPTEKTHFCAVRRQLQRLQRGRAPAHCRDGLRNWAAAAGTALRVSFTPHLLPVDRGILCTMYFRPRPA